MSWKNLGEKISDEKGGEFETRELETTSPLFSDSLSNVFILKNTWEQILFF